MTVILKQGSTGHRHDWYSFLEKVSDNRIDFVNENSSFFELIKVKQKVIISFFDASKYKFLLLIILRGIILRKTGALYFSWSNKKSPNFFSCKIIEYYFFKSIAAFMGIKLITPKFRENTKFLIDINFIDLEDGDKKSYELIKYDFAFFGSLVEEKNIDIFLEIAKKISSRKTILIQSGSKISDNLRTKIESIPKLTFINKRLDKNDYLSLIKQTNFIWAYYDRYYDQSSGLVGHALQLNKNVIIRKNSLLGNLQFPNLLKLNSFQEVFEYFDDHSVQSKHTIDLHEFKELEICKWKNFLS